MISPYEDEQAWKNQYLMMASNLKLKQFKIAITIA